MRVGYRRARSRYARRDRYRLMEFFRVIEQAADSLLSEAVEGDELHIETILSTYSGRAKLLRESADEYGQMDVVDELVL